MKEQNRCEQLVREEWQNICLLQDAEQNLSAGWCQVAVSLLNVERLSWDTARDLDAYLLRGMK